jgi:hypothetical protein
LDQDSCDQRGRPLQKIRKKFDGKVNLQILTIDFDQPNTLETPTMKALHEKMLALFLDKIATYMIGYNILSRSRIERSDGLPNVEGSNLASSRNNIPARIPSVRIKSS